MDPIKPLDGLAEILRKQLGAEVAAKSGTHAVRKSADIQHRQPVQRMPVNALHHKIAEAVARLDPDDPKRNRKLVRLFVENTLSWKFGNELVNDPGFSALVEEVSGALEEQAGLIEQLAKEG